MSVDVSLAIIGKPSGFAGYAFGYRQPTLRLSLRVAMDDAAQLAALDVLLAPELGAYPQVAGMGVRHSLLSRLSHWVAVLEEKSGAPIFEKGRTINLPAPRHDTWVVIQPCLNPKSCLRAFTLMVGIINQALAGDAQRHAQHNAKSAATVLDEIRSTIQQLNSVAPRGFNSVHFLRAAFDLNVPWHHIASNVFQFGWGAHSRWLSSSFTDHTPQISAQLARDKAIAAAVLRSAGVPVPSHFRVLTQDDAVRRARQLGYPVVVKPADLDGGVGVAANLQSDAAVRKAFDQALLHSKQVLLEKHVEGRDYRLQVVQGQVQGVLVRVPGGVTGDGVRSVRALLDAQNLRRRTATDDQRFLKEMSLDEEAIEMLAGLALSADSVPAAGQFVRLRGAANVASGGIPIQLPLDQVHADNLELALRAVDALRLDVAGVDLLIPDIEQSWLVVGAAICEVNAQPQMFSSMHRPMLQQLMAGGNGRIPTVVVLGDDATGKLGLTLLAALAATGITAGWAAGDETWIASRCISKDGAGAHTHTLALLRDRRVQAFVLSLRDDHILRQGWPIDRCDVLLLVHSAFEANAGKSADQVFSEVLGFARGLQPRRVLVSAAAPHCFAQASAIFARETTCELVGTADSGSEQHRQHLVEAVMRALAADA